MPKIGGGAPVGANPVTQNKVGGAGPKAGCKSCGPGQGGDQQDLMKKLVKMLQQLLPQLQQGQQAAQQGGQPAGAAAPPAGGAPNGAAGGGDIMQQLKEMLMQKLQQKGVPMNPQMEGLIDKAMGAMLQGGGGLANAGM